MILKMQMLWLFEAVIFLLDLMRTENDAEVAEHILFNLCKCFPQSTGSLSNLVNVINNMMDTSSSLSYHYASMLSSSCALLGSLVPSSSSHDKQCSEEVVNNDEVVVERLISMLQDCDYRVRFFLCKKNTSSFPDLGWA
ncbi:uncharacterized protein LOC120252787 [Dioscorea cayenensis subsp. rotundata]|uniref:Uncharacterized protein LOC120252787 n=1 Tax=Dioscorea cayennensis subsp. rotundata TaxID=55577 RepID=A0AB40APA6_DIOCR|nr:uncharacterized protein LOC120252787 [Dioscorea cayenensis subsp. rotundata]XP_039116880.1 uncharacterized protein LOC120252787 [Dioscorea cayenensis subsp. rotundata]XP_039116881.1 uncharacterized protein LOC120252787 [Dioscorea cayenensis subsp. rotundata]